MARGSSGTVRSADVRAAVAAVLRRVDLWPTAVLQWFRMVPDGWWRHRPFLPVPSRAYLEFRLLTAYGSEPRPEEGVDLAGDLVTYLEWCRRWPGH